RSEVGEVRREMTADGLEIRRLEEALTRILFGEQGDVRSVVEALTGRDGQREHPLESGQLAVDRRGLGALVEPLIGVCLHLIGIDIHGPTAPEVRAEAVSVVRGVLERSAAVHLVVAHERVREVIDGQAFGAWIEIALWSTRLLRALTEACPRFRF